MPPIKLHIFSHLCAFATGIYVGKSIDAEELAAYRSASYDATSAWIKKIFLGMGFVVVVASGIALFGFGKTDKISSSTSTSSERKRLI